MNPTLLFAGCAALGLSAFSINAASVSPEDAPKHVGETATVCGVVASAKYAANSRAQPTFLDLGKPYPNQFFTAVIFGEERAKFGTPENSLRGKRICVTGQIRDYRGKPGDHPHRAKPTDRVARLAPRGRSLTLLLQS